DHLAVQDGVAQVAAEPGQLRVRRADLVAPAAVQPRGAAVAHGDRANAVPFELVRPAGTGRQRAGGRQHRRERGAWHATDATAPPRIRWANISRRPAPRCNALLKAGYG